MRILVVDSVYPAFMTALRRKRPDLVEANHEAQLDAFYAECFGTADGYVAPLAALGHETAHVLCNDVPSQRAWLREHPGLGRSALVGALGRPGRAGRWAQRATLLAQVESLRPDVLFIDDLWEVDDRQLDWLRRRVPFLVAQIASYPPPLTRMARFDLMLSSFPHFVERFRAAGIDAERFNLAFLPRVTQELASVGVDAAAAAPGRAGAVFVGGFHPGTYERATPALEQLCREIDIAVYGPTPDSLSADSPIRARYRGEAWGLEMYRHFAQARVVINRHSDFAEGHANNMRLYEATGVGATLVTEAAGNLPEILEPGREVVTYDDGDELVAQVGTLLADPATATRVAAAGQARTQAEHTYDRRMAQLDGLLSERRAAGRFRPARRRSYSAT